MDERSKKDITVKMMEVIAHLFYRKRTPREWRLSSSKLFLKDLPETFENALKEHNQRAMKCITDFFMCVIEEYKELNNASVLPLSKLQLHKENSEKFLNNIPFLSNYTNLPLHSVFESLNGKKVEPFTGMEDLKTNLR